MTSVVYQNDVTNAMRVKYWNDNNLMSSEGTVTEGKLISTSD